MEKVIDIPKKTLLAHFKRGEGVPFTQYGLELVVVERKQLNKVLQPIKKQTILGLTQKQMIDIVDDIEAKKAVGSFLKRNKEGKTKFVSLDDLGKKLNLK